MKAERREPDFSPVTLTLESQAEVDAVYAVFNVCSIADGLHDAGQPRLSEDVRNALRDYISVMGEAKMQKAVCDACANKGKGR